MLKAVIDSNVFIAGLLKNATCRRIISALKNSKFTPVASPATLDELIGVLARPKFHNNITQDIAERLIEAIQTQAVIVKPRKKLSLVKEDPDDNMFLEAAMEAKADFIVSGDRHLLSLKNSPVSVITPSEFLKVLKKR